MDDMDDHCKLDKGEVFQGYDCLLNFVDEKSDKFYRIQVLKNDKGFHVWTRWGRNGTDGQSKLEGPISQEDAKKNFKNKFQEKTKNSWDERQQFSPVKGKYSLIVEKTDSSKSSQVTDSQTLQKPEFPDVLILSEVQLPVDVLCVILSQLPVRDVLRYMQVCKAWKTLLSDKYFWKMYIQRHFDLGIKSDLSDEGPMAEWSGPGWTDNMRNGVDETWYCYFSEDGEKDDIYVMRPFPSMWNCRVVHPFGLDPFSGDVRSLQGFYRSLEILTYMRNEASRLGMRSGNECSSNEGQNEICAVIFPWDKKELPTPLELVNGIFHFHPEIYEYYTSHPEDKGYLRENKLHFHIRRNEHNIDDSDVDYDEDDDDHDSEEKPCLNSIFGMGFPDQDEQWMYEDSRKFYEWLRPIMYPSFAIYVGGLKFNPVAIFMLAQLAPGWVGGALTAATWT